MGERIKLEVYSGLPIVQEMIKDSAIVKEMGEHVSWMDSRIYQRTVRNFQYKFTAGDVVKLNKAIWRIGERLSATRIEYDECRQTVIDRVKENLSPVWVSYIYMEKMKKNKSWWNNRMKRTESKGSKSTFSAEDVIQINLAVAEIAARLLSIELTVEE